MSEFDRIDHERKKGRFDGKGSEKYKSLIPNMVNYYGSDSSVTTWVKWLAARGASVNARDAYGQTPLSWAVRKKNPALVDTLLFILNADPTVTCLENGKERTIIDLAQAQKEDPASAEIIALIEKTIRPTTPASSASSTSATPQPQPKATSWLTAEAEEEPTVSLAEFKQKIALISQSGDLLKELRELANDTGDQHAISKIQAILDRIDILSHQRIRLGNICGEIVGALMKNHAVDYSENKQNANLLTWVKWFLDRGLLPDALDAYGYPLLIEAIGKRRADIVDLLMSHGANPNLEVIESGRRRGTALHYAQEKCNAGEKGQKEIVAILKGKPLAVLTPGAPTATGAAAPSLTSTTAPVTATPITSLRYKAFTRTQALWATIAAAITLSAAYKWFTNSYTGKEENILINNTGKTISVFRDKLPPDTVEPGKSLTLEEVEELAIKLESDSVASELTIDLEGHADKRKDHYLNLVISKNWLPWLFGTLNASPRWIKR